MDFKLEKMKINKFRNISSKNIDFILDFKPGINLISGHNGVGKSNILSLISSGTGVYRFDSPSKNNFQPEFYNYFKIGEEENIGEYDIYSIYSDSEMNRITKKLRFKNDTASNRGIRVIPTNDNNFTDFETITSASKYIKETFSIGHEGRIKIPTRYVSISRLFPLGESDLEQADIRSNNKIIKNKLDEQYAYYYNQVLPDSIQADAKIYSSNKKETKTPSLGMEISNTNRNSKSVGQDSLDTIISVLIDFYWLKQEEKSSYLGGILCIDEIDISLHPLAQIKLIKLLEECSKDLNLQIFITTHSLTIIKELSKKIEKQKQKNETLLHSINYIKDKSLPTITRKNEYSSIKSDMFLENSTLKPKIKFYFEDEVGIELHDNLMNVCSEIFDINYKKNNYIYISAKIGKSQLRHLNSKNGDPGYFNNVGIILDGDSRFSDSKPVDVSSVIKNGHIGKYPKRNDLFNVLILPYVLPPECFLYYIFNYYVSAVNSDEAARFWYELEDVSEISYSREYFIEHDFILDTRSDFDTETIKKHVKSKQISEFIYSNNVLEFYYKQGDRKDELEEYYLNFNKIVDILSSRNFKNKF